MGLTPLAQPEQKKAPYSSPSSSISLTIAWVQTLTNPNQLFFDQIVETAAESEELQQAAQANSQEGFSLLFKQILQSLFVERVDQNEAIFAQYMNDRTFEKVVFDYLSSTVYKRLSTTQKK